MNQYADPIKILIRKQDKTTGCWACGWRQKNRRGIYECGANQPYYPKMGGKGLCSRWLEVKPKFARGRLSE